MSTTTTILSLVKPDGTDTVNEGTHLNDNWDILDGLWTSTAPGNSAVGDAASASTGGSLRAARVDHRHGRESFGSPAAVGTANSDGVATTVARSDHVHLGGVNPTGTAGSPGIILGADGNSGIYQIANDNIGISVNGTKEIDISATVVAFSHDISAVGATLSGNLSAVDGAFSDDVTISDDLAVSGLATIGETLVVTGIATFTGGYRVGAGTVRTTARLLGSATWNPGSIDNLERTATNVTVTGATTADFVVSVSHASTDEIGDNDMFLDGMVDGADSVAVVLFNAGGGVRDLTSDTVRVVVEKVSAT